MLNIASGATVTIADSANPGNTAAVSVLTDLYNSRYTRSQEQRSDRQRPRSVHHHPGGHHRFLRWRPLGQARHHQQFRDLPANAGVYGLGYATATELGSPATFEGQTLSSGATVVKYTLLGDTTLKGSVNGGDFQTVVSNLNSTGDWSQGNFFYGGTINGADFQAVVSNLNSSAVGNVIKSGGITRALSPAVTYSVAPSTAFHLEVNTSTGAVSIENFASTASALTLYNIYSPSGNDLLIGNPADGNGTTNSHTGATNETYAPPYTNELFLSVAASDSNAVASIAGRSATNWKNWSIYQDGFSNNGGLGLFERSSQARGRTRSTLPPGLRSTWGSSSTSTFRVRT